MARTKRDPKSRRDMCDRFVWLMETALRLRPGVLAKMLGYTNATTITKVKQREAFPDPERLRTLAGIKTKDGACPNLHWLITGDGTPLIGRGSREIRKSRAVAETIIRKLGPERVEALERVLSDLKAN